MPKKNEPPLIEQVGHAVRRMGAQSVLMSEAMASRFGMNSTDLECLDVLFLRGEATAGELAKATGLTSGATTTMIDRLVEAGYIRRDNDPNDRRRVILRVRPEKIGPIARAYEPIAQRTTALWSTFSEKELATVLRFIEESVKLSVDWIEELQQAEKARKKKK
jgi:DNA-binding MarR family transcriptional regulator